MVSNVHNASVQQGEQCVCVYESICWGPCSGTFTDEVNEHKGLGTTAYTGMIRDISKHFKGFLYNKYTLLCTFYIYKMETICHKHFWETRRKFQNHRSEHTHWGWPFSAAPLVLRGCFRWDTLGAGAYKLRQKSHFFSASCTNHLHIHKPSFLQITFVFFFKTCTSF